MQQARLALRLHCLRSVRHGAWPMRSPLGCTRSMHPRSATAARCASEDSGPSAASPLLQPGLHVVGTPIGNLQDLSPRALAVLRGADKILCEDTRHTLRLCNHFGISTPLESLHEHNESAKCTKVVQLLQAGACIALVSDAGMPAISDPGGRLIAAVVDAGLPIVPIPGPSAPLAAAVASGFDTSRLYFVGFLPAKQSARRQELEQLQGVRGSIVMFVSPHALHAALRDACDVLGRSRRCMLGREMTKLHEEFIRGTLGEVAARFDPGQGAQLPRGEFTLVLAPDTDTAGQGQAACDAQLQDEEIMSALQSAVRSGLTRSAAAASVAASLGVGRRRAYQLSLALDPRGNAQAQT